MVRFLNGKDHSLDVSSSLDHSNTEPIEIRPSKYLDFEGFRILNGRISDPHCSVKNGRIDR